MRQNQNKSEINKSLIRKSFYVLMIKIFYFVTYLDVIMKHSEISEINKDYRTLGKIVA